MPTFRFSKLVRDKIVDNQIALGSTPRYRVLSTNEHKKELVNKIIEEAQEIYEATPDKMAEEIVDVQQAIDDLKELCGVSDDAVSRAQGIKNKKSGAFKKGIYIEYTELRPDDAWVA